MKVLRSMVFCLFLIQGVSAQDPYSVMPDRQNESKEAVQYRDRAVRFRINFISPSFEIEGRIASNSNTVLFDYHPGFVWYSDGKSQTEFAIIPQFKFAYRNYYNLQKRINKGKTTAKFSGNFIALNLNYNYQTSITNSYIIFGPTWGIQRNYGGFFHLSVEIGPGIIFAGEFGQALTVIADLRLGFTI